MTRRVESVGAAVLVTEDPNGIIGELLQGLLAESDEQLLTALRKGTRATVMLGALVARGLGGAVWMVTRPDGATMSIGGEEIDRLYGQAYDIRRWQQMSAFPIGITLDHGRYTITDLLYGTPERGVYRARAAGSSSRAIVTLGTAQRDLEDARNRLALPDAAFAELMYVGPLESKVEQRYDALVELEPEGMSLADDGVTAEQAVPTALAIARVVAGCHARGVVAGGLRPELIYLRPDRPTVGRLLPRCDRFLLTATTPSYGVTPCFTDWYTAPEVLARPELAPTPAADVFAVGVMLALWSRGEHPFEGQGMRQMMSVTIGRRRPWTGSERLGMIVAAMVAPSPEPEHRFAMAEVVEFLEGTAE